MKAYTDIEQSKKLAEFLSLESADMWYLSKDSRGIEFFEEPVVNDGTREDDDIPCWSLAALLDIMPTHLFEFDRGIDLNIYPHLNGRRWHCSYMPNCIENMKTDKFKLITSGDTLVDACVAMIEKLHEQKLL